MQTGVQLRAITTRTTGAWQLSHPEWAMRTEFLGHNLPIYLILVPFFFPLSIGWRFLLLSDEKVSRLVKRKSLYKM